MKNDAHALTSELERKARAIARRREGWETSPQGMIARELTLTLEELGATQSLHAELAAYLLEMECRLGTALLQAQEMTATQGLHGQLAALQAEQRRLALTKHERLTMLRHRLLSLVEKHNTLMLDED